MKTTCRHCEKTFSVPESWRNTKIRCPQCNQEIFVGDSDKLAQPARGGSRKPTAPAETAAADDDDYLLAPEVERPKMELFDEQLSDAKPKRPRSRSESPAQVPPAAVPSARDGQECPNCAAIVPAGGLLCVHCGYHLVKKRVLQTHVEVVDYDESIGIQRWLHRQISEFESLESLVWAWHAVLIALGVILAAVFYPWGWLVFIVVAGLYTAWFQYTRRRDGFRAWGNWLWDKHLALRRRFSWRSWRWPFHPLRQFISQSPDFSDEHLLALEDVESFEVLDLEGTAVSQRGFARLAGCQNLRYVVLRRTRVTAEAARRLQVMLPDVNIWI